MYHDNVIKNICFSNEMNSYLNFVSFQLVSCPVTLETDEINLKYPQVIVKLICDSELT